jgi:hypothetical protein
MCTYQRTVFHNIRSAHGKPILTHPLHKTRPSSFTGPQLIVVARLLCRWAKSACGSTVCSFMTDGMENPTTVWVQSSSFYSDVKIFESFILFFILKGVWQRDAYVNIFVTII